MRRWLILSACLIAISGCSLADLLNGSIPRSGYHIHRDIAYGSLPRQKLDLYVPKQKAANAPVVVFFYGGSWQFGSKKDYRFLGQALTNQGFLVAVADYRLYPDVRYPAFIHDAAQATTFIHGQIAQYGGDPHKLFVAGHSAGAYLAMMVGADPAYMQGAGGQRDWIRGVIGIAGPYDFRPITDATLKKIFRPGPEKAVMPLTRITAKMPPVMLATGATDDTVDPRNSHRVKARLESLQSPVEEYIYPDTGHIGIVLSIAHGFRERTTLLADMTAFIRRVSAEP